MTIAAGIDKGIAFGVQADGNVEAQQAIDTVCLGCVFADGDFKQTDESLTFWQNPNGCFMGTLAKLRKAGADVQEAEDGSGNGFHVIKARLCPFHRTPQWNGWGDQDMEVAKKRVRAEVTLRAAPDVVIYFDDTMDTKDILTTIKALDRGVIRPKRVYIINNSMQLRPSQVMRLMQDCPLPWRTETVTEVGCDAYRAMDIMMKKCTAMFVTCFAAGFEPHPNFFKDIDAFLYDELGKFILLEPDEGDKVNGLVVLRIFYKQAGGNSLDSIINKAQRISKDQKCQHMIKPVREVVAQLSQ